MQLNLMKTAFTVISWSAYNQIDLPLLPGSWKIYDLEKSGSVPLVIFMFMQL